MNISYSFAAPADLPSARSLLTDCALPAEDVHEHFEHFVIAKDGEDVVGVIGLEPLGRSALLRSLAVAHRYRGRGIGRELYGRILAYAHARGAVRLYLLTLGAQDYFTRLGFQVVVRAEVPDEVRATEEFRNLCPDTAVCLARQIGEEIRCVPGEVPQLRPDVAGAGK